jgi:putative ABC transport system substrate-binding protein
MRRRDFITLLGGAVAAWPIAARAEQSQQMRRIGVLMSYLESDGEAQEQTKAFSQSLKEFGWTDGVNIRLDYRWPGSDADRLRADALELVRLAPDVLLAGATPAVMRSKTRPALFQLYLRTLLIPLANASLRPWRSRAPT